MAFKELLEDLNTLAKSQGGDADDANIQAAGATGGDSGDGGEGAAGADAAGDAGAAGGDAGAGGEGDEEGGEVVKSFAVTLENGDKFEAVDATELVKSLTTRIEDVESSTGEALGLCVSMLKSLAADNVSLRADLAKLAKTGSGRTALLSISAKAPAAAAGGSTLAKSTPAAMNAQEFMLKSDHAFNAGQINGRDLALIETHINRGEAVPAHLIQKVMGSAAA